MGQPVDHDLSVVDVDRTPPCSSSVSGWGGPMETGRGKVEPHLSEEQLGGDRFQPLGQVQEGAAASSSWR
ncbi:hypothetical protein ACGFSI_40840 [Streptomyces virginiae]|uniref:hypothetical protein n=1 Tax=Streptomyces virginiae TaxID=1961 RepID=UPI00371EA2C3